MAASDPSLDRPARIRTGMAYGPARVILQVMSQSRVRPTGLAFYPDRPDISDERRYFGQAISRASHRIIV